MYHIASFKLTVIGLMREYAVFTSESVSEGHPDKMADQISDAILDAILKEDPYARVACETLVKTGAVVLAGEITTTANVDFEAIVRQTVNGIGYHHSDLGFDGSTCAVINMIGKQSPEIAQGVDRQKPEDQGAGARRLLEARVGRMERRYRGGAFPGARLEVACPAPRRKAQGHSEDRFRRGRKPSCRCAPGAAADRWSTRPAPAGRAAGTRRPGAGARAAPRPP